ncbi:spore germination protein KA [Halobacillus andaensis]|uniref:Spore germination protein KA n=1 Tax=Halobacillus andaensis TaxID=1176239 RepID=A0A917B4Y0_HALAA|nr:spore germination protein [Halobacillus andaensis]MBP2004348.1 spore germination protein KA [Halobacillus andaensis]GGF22310.1 spore germination protein KA [Halobacillus andaensis]
MKFDWNPFHKKKQETRSGNSQKELPISDDLSQNIKRLSDEFGDNSEIIIRELNTGMKKDIRVVSIYMDGLVDQTLVNEFILESLKLNHSDFDKNTPKKDVFNELRMNALTLSNVKVINDWDQLVLTILSGSTLVMIDGWNEVLSGETQGWEERAIQEPTSQTVVRGPKDSFTESLKVNVTLIRKRIKNVNLRVETFQIGTVSRTNISIMYMKGIAKDDLIQEVKRRLEKIDTDSIIESGNLEEFIQDHTSTPFPQLVNSERPDAAVGNLLDGRVVILVDGTPFVLIAPATFFQFFQSPEDYYQRADIATLLRLLRFFVFFLSLFAPSIYIALTTYHQEMLPFPLLINLAAQREGVPFPAFVEALIMEVTFEILREAGVRMPRAVGQAVSIVGAIVIGEAAVQAGIISPAMVIVVGITAISSFAVPSFSIAIPARILRFLLMVSAATAGFYGMILLVIMMAAHMNSLRSFGVPYLEPLSPFNLAAQADTFVRLPPKVKQKFTFKRDNTVNTANPLNKEGDSNG